LNQLIAVLKLVIVSRQLGCTFWLLELEPQQHYNEQFLIL
jgi:hypothetical protein